VGDSRLRLLAATALIVVGAGIVLLRRREHAVVPVPPSSPHPTSAIRGAGSDDLESIRSSARESLVTRTEEPTVPAGKRKPIVLIGSVRDASGGPIESLRAWIRVTDAHGNVRLASIREGSYAIDRLEPGAWDLDCEAVGYRPRTRTIQLRSDEPEHREDFVLERGWTIAIRLVTPDGRNLLDRDVQRDLPPKLPLSIVATGEPPGEHVRASPFESRADSAWFPHQADDGTAGLLDVRGEPPTHVSAVLGDDVLTTRRVEVRVDALDLEIPIERLRSIRCSVVGRVVDSAARQSVPGAIASLIDEHGIRQEAEMDASGDFRAKSLLPGRYTLTVHGPTYAYEIRPVELRAGVENDLGTIELGSGVSLRGKFVDPDGRPAQAEASLFPYSKEREFEDLKVTFAEGIAADEDGSFEEEHIAPGKYVLQVRPFLRVGAGIPDWVAPPVLVDLTRGAIDDLVVPVHVGVELLLRPISDEVRDLGYWIVSSQSLPDRYGCFAGNGVVKERMAPGTYKLLLGRGGRVLREIPFSVGEVPMSLDVDR
jgi:protocatechuate 3,4-dioxygenase beta subunit